MLVDGKLLNIKINVWLFQYSTLILILQALFTLEPVTPTTCGTQSSLRLGAPMNFDRCAVQRSPQMLRKGK